MLSTQIFGQIENYDCGEFVGEEQVTLHINTSLSIPLTKVLHGEEIESCLHEWHIDRLHAFKGLCLSVDVEVECDEDSGKPVAYNVVRITALDKDDPRCWIETVKRERHFVPYTVPAEVRYCAN